MPQPLPPPSRKVAKALADREARLVAQEAQLRKYLSEAADTIIQLYRDLAEVETKEARASFVEVSISYREQGESLYKVFKRHGFEVECSGGGEFCTAYFRAKKEPT